MPEATFLPFSFIFLIFTTLPQMLPEPSP
jgi:hypothetical protein